MNEYEYMLVSNDEYELPIFTAESMSKLAKIMGCGLSTVSEALRNNAINREFNAKFVKVVLKRKQKTSSNNAPNTGERQQVKLTGTARPEPNGGLDTRPCDK